MQKILKKQIILPVLTALFLQSTAFAGIYVEDLNEYVLTDTSMYDTSVTEQVFDLNISNSFVLEADIYAGADIYMVTDKGNFQFYDNLNSSRGAILRENNTPVWFYNENGTKLEIGTSKKSYKFNINLVSGTVTTYVDGSLAVYSSDENSYVPASYAFSGSTIKSFSVKGGKISNIKVYYPPKTDSGAENSEYAMQKSALLKLGVINTSLNAVELDTSLTRGQFASMLYSLLKLGSYSGESAFSDVKPGSINYNAANALNSAGIMPGYEKSFKPNKTITVSEAVSAIARALGFNNAIGSKKESYIVYATLSDFNKYALDKITFKAENQELNMKDAVHLIYNMLTAPVYEIDLSKNKPTYKTNFDKDRTILSSLYGYYAYEVDIETVKRSTRNVDVIFEDKTTGSYETDKMLSLLNVEGTKQMIWLNRDTEVIDHMYPIDFSRTVYGVISEYNRNKDSGTINADKLSSIKLSGIDDFIKVDSDHKVYQNGAVVSGVISPVGQLVRLDISENEVVRTNIIGDSIVERGIVAFRDDERITYIEGSSTNTLDLTDFGDIITLLNGEEVSYDAIMPGMYFDSITADGRAYLLFSDRVYSGVLGLYGTDEIKVDDMLISISVRTLYTSTNGGNTYDAKTNVSKLIGSDVVVYTDMMGVARYMYTNGMVETYGVVKKAYIGDDGEERFMKVALVQDGEMVTKELKYPKTSKTIFPPYVSYDEAALKAGDINGDGVFKFRISGDEIRSIEQIEWKGEMETDGDTIQYTNRRIQNKSSGFTYVDPEATIISLLNSKEEFEPRLHTLYSLNGYKTTGFSTFKYRVDNELPMASLVILGENYVNLYNSSWFCGVVVKINETYEDGEEYFEYEISSQKGDTTYKRLQTEPLMVAGEPVAVGDIILYAISGVENEIQDPFNTRRLSFDRDLEPYYYNSSSESSIARNFIYAGELQKEQSGFVLTMCGGEEQWYKKSNLFRYVRYTNSGQLEDATINEIIGKDVFIYSNDGMAEYVIAVDMD